MSIRLNCPVTHWCFCLGICLVLQGILRNLFQDQKSKTSVLFLLQTPTFASIEGHRKDQDLQDSGLCRPRALTASVSLLQAYTAAPSSAGSFLLKVGLQRQKLSIPSCSCWAEQAPPPFPSPLGHQPPPLSTKGRVSLWYLGRMIMENATARSGEEGKGFALGLFHLAFFVGCFCGRGLLK